MSRTPGRIPFPNPNGNNNRRATTDATRGAGNNPLVRGGKRQPAAANGGAGDGGEVKAGKPRLERPTIASTLRATNATRQREQAAVVASLNKPSKLKSGSGTVTIKKEPNRVMTPLAKQAARARLWPSGKTSGGGAYSKADKLSLSAEEFRALETGLDGEPLAAAAPAQSKLVETGIQTDEAEILDLNLLKLNGDIRIVAPSPQLVDQIEKSRRDAKAKSERQSMRRFASHEQDEEQHLDELKEFTERNAVTKRTPKQSPILPTSYGNNDNQHINVFKSMDEFFLCGIPKSESIIDIQRRIKLKEDELMRLFSDVDPMIKKPEPKSDI